MREAQVQGIGLSVVELAGRLPDVPEATIAELLGLLERERIAQRTDIGNWILSRDPDLVRIRALYRGEAFLLPLSDGKHTSAQTSSFDARIEQLCENAAQAAERQLDHALADLFRKASARNVESKAEDPTQVAPAAVAQGP